MRIHGRFIELLHIASAFKFVLKHYDLYTKDMMSMEVVPHGEIFKSSPDESDVFAMKENFEEWANGMGDHMLHQLKIEQESPDQIQEIIDRMKKTVSDTNG